MVVSISLGSCLPSASVTFFIYGTILCKQILLLSLLSFFSEPMFTRLIIYMSADLQCFDAVGWAI